jgi:hypothetical protein
MLKIQKFIDKFPSIRDANRALSQELGIIVKEDELRLPDFVTERVYVYNYDILSTPHDDPIGQECRGLILDEHANVISMPFTRFFNSYEGAAAELDWFSARAFEKLDGTMIAIYSHREQFFIQTRGSAMAEGLIAGLAESTYCDAVQAYFARKHGDYALWAKDFAPGFIYIFEFVAPYNRIVTPYDRPDMYLLGIRNKADLQEAESWVVDDVARKHDFKRPFGMPCLALAGVKAMIEDLDPTEEGFVVQDANFNRVKVKNPRYLAISRAVNAGEQLSAKHFAAVAINGDGEETKSYFPNYSDAIDFFVGLLIDIKADLHRLWAAYGGLERKPFALKIKNHPFSGVLFQMKGNKINTIEDGLMQVKPQRLVEFAREYHADTFKLVFDELLSGGQ